MGHHQHTQSPDQLHHPSPQPHSHKTDRQRAAMAPSQPRQPLASCLPLLLLLLLLAGTLQPARACLPEGAVNAGVTQGKPTHVCIVASPLTWTEGTNNFSRVAFLPNTDRFSRLNFTGTFSNTTDAGLLSLFGTPNVAIHVESMGVVSYQKLYRAESLEDGIGKTFPVFTAIITVDKGVVTGIAFDNGCPLCDNDARCEPNTYDYTGNAYDGKGATSDCFVSDEDCAADPQQCQLMVYVSWTGTDRNGNYLTSSSRRFSLFSSYSVNSYVNGLGKAIRGVQTSQFEEGR